jgi:hypothetical protein
MASFTVLFYHVTYYEFQPRYRIDQQSSRFCQLDGKDEKKWGEEKCYKKREIRCVEIP